MSDENQAPATETETNQLLRLYPWTVSYTVSLGKL